MGKRGRPPHPDILTPREWEVLALLRLELSNPEIAERLGISRDGAKYHVSQILAKLGLESREQAALWQYEGARPRWATAFAPLLPAWRRTAALVGGASGTAARAALFVMVLAAAGGLSLLAALLFLQSGDSDDAPTLARSSAQLSYIDEDGALWLVNADSSDRRKLVDDGTCGRSSLDWSPTGQRLICHSRDDRVVIRDVDGAIVSDVTIPDLISIEWSPNGMAFLYWTSDNLEVDQRVGDVRYELFLADDSGKLLAELGSWDPAGIRPGQAYSGFPLWSPDGDQLAYRTANTGETHIYSLDAGSEQTLAGDYHPLGWAFEGQTLIVATNYKPAADIGSSVSFEANLLDLHTSGLERVPMLDSGRQFWTSPDGSSAVYLTIGQRSDGLPSLGVIDLRTGEPVLIEDSLITYGSDHIPKEFLTFAQIGDYIYWNSGDGSAYRARIDGTELEQLFDVGELFLTWSPDAAMVAYTLPDPVDSEERLVRLLVTTADGGATYEIAQKPYGSGSASQFPFAWRPVPR